MFVTPLRGLDPDDLKDRPSWMGPSLKKGPGLGRVSTPFWGIRYLYPHFCLRRG